MPIRTLSWSQVNAWRLSQHGLSPRLEKRDLVKAVTRTVGIQAQVLSAAELALWARVDGLTREAVRTALWQDRTLIKTWAMRGTLHLLAVEDLPLYVAARSLDGEDRWDRYFDSYGFSPAQHQAYLAALPQVLGREPMTRAQLAEGVARETGIDAFKDLILSANWGSPLKPAAFRGELCFGPSQGQNVTFVNPQKWLKDWKSIDPQQALQTITRRYLEAYGPATPEDFSRWWWGGAGLLTTRKLFQSMKAELEEVEVEGWRAFALRESLESMASRKKANSIHLLPLFDAYTLGLGRDIEPLLPQKHRGHVFRPQGWISAVVLVDGYMKGVWEHKTRRTETTVKVQLFSPPTASMRKGIETEAQRLGLVLNTSVSLDIGQKGA